MTSRGQHFFWAKTICLLGAVLHHTTRTSDSIQVKQETSVLKFSAQQTCNQMQSLCEVWVCRAPALQPRESAVPDPLCDTFRSNLQDFFFTTCCRWHLGIFHTSFHFSQHIFFIWYRLVGRCLECKVHIQSTCHPVATKSGTVGTFLSSRQDIFPS